MQGYLEMNAGHFDEISDCWSSEEQPALYYRTAAARARRLQADATTPRVKQYLDKMIVHCERLAGKVERRLALSIGAAVSTNPSRYTSESVRAFPQVQ
jgi:hypothetical protein